MNHSLKINRSEQIRAHCKNDGGNTPPLFVDLLNCIITIKNEYCMVGSIQPQNAPLAIITNLPPRIIKMYKL